MVATLSELVPPMNSNVSPPHEPAEPHTPVEAPPQSSRPFVIPPPHYSLLRSLSAVSLPFIVTMFPFVSSNYSLPIPVCYPLPLFLL